ncbi:MAG: hypothetical protein Q7R95_01255 [bacterium]|nr:hypothetical protein [bacterium]
MLNEIANMNSSLVINTVEILIPSILGTIYLMVYKPFITKNAKEAIQRVKEIDQKEGAYLTIPPGKYNLPIDEVQYNWILDVFTDETGYIRGIPPASSNVIGGTVKDQLGKSNLYIGNLEQILNDSRGEACVISEPVDITNPADTRKKVFGVVAYKPGK